MAAATAVKPTTKEIAAKLASETSAMFFAYYLNGGHVSENVKTDNGDKQLGALIAEVFEEAGLLVPN